MNVERIAKFLLGLILFFAAFPPAPGQGAGGGWKAPELPRAFVDTTYHPPSGRTIAVPAGGNFQAALNAAAPGDVITLQEGATYVGPFTLPAKLGSDWVTIRTSAPDSRIPSPGTPVRPVDAKVMPALVAGSKSVIISAPKAHHYRFVGIEFRPSERTFLYSLVQLGEKERSADQLPHHIIFDRCYLHGDPLAGSRRGIAMNSASTAVIDSYLTDFKEVGRDSQAIMSWNGTGPFKIVNNTLVGAGENIMFGGADPTIPNLVPSDIEIRGNHFSKPLAWKVGDPAYAGKLWSVKNLFELKNAQRVLVDGNIFEQNWVGADQHGAAILFTVRDQDGSAPWAIVADVTFTHNIIREATAAIEILGQDTSAPSQPAQRVLVQDNLFVDIGGARWAGADRTGRLFQMSNGATDITIDHNTALHTENPLVAAIAIPGRLAQPGLVFTNNIVSHGPYGVAGDNTFGDPLLTLRTYFPDATFTHNVIIGGKPAQYPQGNFFPLSVAAVGFADLAGGDYRLAARSPYRKAGTDGKDVGADIPLLFATLSAWQRAIAHP